ncbi:DUF3370 family protein [Cesiribacter andamanensis]|uniref:Uncharacterized protein n=1 Tax=Cesiribacter andamanensis AMV16 TaxID=1279009 RepID=M7NL88_9BACT|nr:DUF3370 family protein [Cesiribacter andamanensis]EMR02560.1 hypothetical protein ADICEAN_02312 [Cesiribacter andamanensis AMV16]
MKNIQRISRAGMAGIVLCLGMACTEAPFAPEALSAPEAAAASSPIVQSHFTAGTLGSSSKVADNSLHKPTTYIGGNPIWVSNNPEIFQGEGWLMNNAGKACSGRTSAAFPLSGTFNLYLFHINQTGRTAYLHVLVSNPNPSTAITVQSKGSIHTNSSYPLTGAGTGPSFKVAENWMNTSGFNQNTAAASIDPYKVREIARVPMNSANMIDGLLEVTTSGNAYVYTVITYDGATSRAINLSQSTCAPGDYRTESTNTYGREAGVYRYSKLYARIDATIPSYAAYAGFCLNTTAKFNSNLAEQTSDALMTLAGSSSRTYGNYGHLIEYGINLKNEYATGKYVKISMASNAYDPAKNNATFNGPVDFVGSRKTVYLQLNAPKQDLGTVFVPANTTKGYAFKLYVPGLITTNSQLILQVL